MNGTGPAVLVLASLLATVPCVPAAAGQRTPVEPASLDKQQSQNPEPEAQEAERGTAGPKRGGLKGWITERLKEPASTTPDAGGGFSPTAGTVVGGSGLAAGARYRQVNMLP